MDTTNTLLGLALFLLAFCAYELENIRKLLQAEFFDRKHVDQAVKPSRLTPGT